MAKFIEVTRIDNGCRVRVNIDYITEIEEDGEFGSCVTVNGYFPLNKKGMIGPRVYYVKETYIEVADAIHEACEVKVR